MDSERLENKLMEANNEYINGTPIMSDQEYDKLLDKLKEIAPDSELLRTGVIHPHSDSSRKEKLPCPMFSLNKVKSVDEILEWINKYGLHDEWLVITPKFDGISLLSNNRTNYTWTRGNGVEGQRSDSHFYMTGQRHHNPMNLWVFGEAIMLNEDFKKYSDKYANSRNMVAGLFRREEPLKCPELKDVKFVRYGVSTENKDLHSVNLHNLNLLNEVIVPFQLIKAHSIKFRLTDIFLTSLYNEWKEKLPIDGLVIDIDRWEKRVELGREENMNPKYARAIKLPEWETTAFVIIENVKWEVSKNGKLKPVIEIQEVELSGVKINNVTGYNAKYVNEHNIARHSTIEIVRSGEVIPKHLSTINSNLGEIENQWDELAECPSCGSPIKWDLNMVELLCTNPECRDMKINKLVHFFNTLEVEDFGKPTIEKLYDAGFDSYNRILKINKEDFCSINGLGEGMYKTFHKQVLKLNSEGVPLAKILYSLDIFSGKIGEKTCQMILDNFKWVAGDKFIFDRLLEIKGVNEITAKTYIDGMIKWSNLLSSKPFVTVNYVKTPIVEPTGNKYLGLKICFTGVRDKELEQEIEKQGGTIVSGVSKGLAYLIVKSLDSTSSKMKKAKDLGIEIMTVDEFKQL